MDTLLESHTPPTPEVCPVLLCGYRGTGKDTFYTNLCTSGNIHDQYAFYSAADMARPVDPVKNFLYAIAPQALNQPQYQRVAFADALKVEIMKRYNIPAEPMGLEEKNKIQFKNENNKDVSFRDLCIHWALVRRSEDPDYWAKKALEPLKGSTKVVFTDWRFLNEYSVVKEKYPQVITARIFRSGVEIPNESIKSEHELDDFTTDILILPKNVNSTLAEVNASLEGAIAQFPQYKNFFL